MGIRQRLQQNALHHAEDHRVGADANGKGDERDRRKHWGAAEPAQNQPELIDEHCHVPALRGRARVHFSLTRVFCDRLYRHPIRDLETQCSGKWGCGMIREAKPFSASSIWASKRKRRSSIELSGVFEASARGGSGRAFESANGCPIPDSHLVACYSFTWVKGFQVRICWNPLRPTKSTAAEG